MKISYDPEVDALSITFRETTVTTKHLAEGIAADYDSEGRLAGLEILDAQKRFGGTEITRRTVANGEPRKSTPRRSFGPKFFSPASAQEFHLRFESAHAGGDAFIFFRGPGDRSIDRALTDQALKLFINAQAQHLFHAAGSVSFPKIEQDDVEQRLEFK